MFETQFRAALLISLQQRFLDRASHLKEEPFRRGNRRVILDRAARPLLPALGAARYQKLLKALSLVYGIELYVVLKDIWGAREREIKAIAYWALDALVTHALREAGGEGSIRVRGGQKGERGTR